TDTEFSNDQRYDLSKRGYLVHCYNVLNAEEKELSYLLKKSGCQEAEHIILMDNNSINYFSILQVFSMKNGDGGFVLRKGAKITCRCEEDSIAQLIADYYRVEKDCEFGYDLEIVSLPELQVRQMYREVPLYSCYLGKDLPLRE
ncbi:MAG: hypothetical protein VZR73_18605, partial [Acutalibacteraceae bacterium]|nr:hypothetical protein [Acutalibacteraceae bacterium]